MPDPYLYLQASIASAITAAVLVTLLRAIGESQRRLPHDGLNVIAFGVGVIVGLGILSFSWKWWPAQALDRLLMIVLPAAALAELVKWIPGIPLKWSSALWLLLILATPRILIHNSSYLASSDHELVRLAIIGLGSGLLGVIWCLTRRLVAQVPDVSIPISLAMSLLASGMTIMMAGYLKGGTVTLPLAASLMGIVVAERRDHCSTKLQGVCSLAIIALFGALFIGRFFGRLTTGSAIAIMLAPLMCYVTKLPWLRHLSARSSMAVRTAAVLVPLTVVVVIAKIRFDRLLGIP